jgi:hypothetical protein
VFFPHARARRTPNKTEINTIISFVIYLTTLYHWVIDDEMIKNRTEKDVKVAVAYLSYNPAICLLGLRKTAKYLSHNSLSPGRHLNPGPPKHEADVLTTWPRRSITTVKVSQAFVSLGISL